MRLRPSAAGGARSGLRPDRLDADLHVLVTEQETGSGGIEYTLHFLGLKDLAHLADTLRYVSRQVDTKNEVRDGFTRTFRVGLVRYLAQTSRVHLVDVVFPAGAGETDAPAQPVRDPWNLWVFRSRVSGDLQGESRTRSTRMSEVRPERSLEIAADFTQPWGELVLSLTGSHLLDDVARHRLDLYGMTEIRLFRGLSVDLQGNIARIKDQIYVAREEVSDEDVLLRRKELGKDFEYWRSVGLSFTFGSVFNNVVNPRIRTREQYYYYYF